MTILSNEALKISGRYIEMIFQEQKEAFFKEPVVSDQESSDESLEEGESTDESDKEVN